MAYWLPAMAAWLSIVLMARLAKRYRRRSLVLWTFLLGIVTAGLAGSALTLLAITAGPQPVVARADAAVIIRLLWMAAGLAALVTLSLAVRIKVRIDPLDRRPPLPGTVDNGAMNDENTTG
jgi:hypothetical protein